MLKQYTITSFSFQIHRRDLPFLTFDALPLDTASLNSYEASIEHQILRTSTLVSEVEESLM
jgi:hypothetical protein